MTKIGKLDYPKAEVRMYCSSPIEETHRLRACAKEPWTVEWIESMPAGSILYDVGANVGSYSLLAAALGHQVVAIEPSFANYARLCENILLNDLGSFITPLCMALGREWGSPLMEQELTPGYSGGAKRLRVPMFPMRSLPNLFALSPPSHVKLDVDGSEFDVISGAMDVDAPPCDAYSWMVEVQDGQAERIAALLGEPAAIFNARGGVRIKGMAMHLYEPVPVSASPVYMTHS